MREGRRFRGLFRGLFRLLKNVLYIPLVFVVDVFSDSFFENTKDVDMEVIGSRYFAVDVCPDGPTLEVTELSSKPPSQINIVSFKTLDDEVAISESLSELGRVDEVRSTLSSFNNTDRFEERRADVDNQQIIRNMILKQLFPDLGEGQEGSEDDVQR